MRKILSLLIILFIIGCTSSEKQVTEVVTMEDLMDIEGEDENIDIEETILLPLISDGSNFSNLILNLQTQYDTFGLSKGHKMDRYGCSSFKKTLFIEKSDKMSPSAEVYQYNFTDSIKLNNAFYNWLDCFGDNCSEIKLNTDSKGLKSSPSYTLVYDTVLVSIKYSLEHKHSNWKSFQDSIVSHFGGNYRYALQSNLKGRLFWEKKKN